MANLIVPNQGLDPILVNVRDNVLGGCKFILFQAATTIVAASVYADVTGGNEANFGGYGQINPVFGAVTFDGSVHYYTLSQVAVWIWTGSPTNTIYGGAIIDVVNSKLIAGFNFTSPLVVDGTNPIVAVQFQFTDMSEF
jgi:hypothetical protein